MPRASIDINVGFLIITALLGNVFVKLNFIVGSFFFYSLLIYNVVYFFKNVHLGTLFLPVFSRNLSLFLLLSTVYIILSFLSFSTVFGIKDLVVKAEFILRQAYFIPFLFFIGCNLVYDIVRRGAQLSIICRYPLVTSLSLLLGSFMISKMLFQEVTISATTQLVISSSCLYLCFYKKQSAFAITILSLWLLAFIYGSTGGILAILFFIYYFKVSISKYVKGIAVSLCFLVLVMGLTYKDITYFLSVNDPNSWWRFVYWTHEFFILKDTYFLGVGFGTPYAKNDIFKVINEFNVIEGGNLSADEMQYVVGQHNSIVNIFYRLGLFGGTCFCYINYLILRYSYKTIRILKSAKREVEMRFVLWCEFSYVASLIIILFNVGLETPRFFLPFVISSFMLIGIISKYNKSNISVAHRPG